MTFLRKPPIGIVPKKNHDLNRVDDILDGLIRYSEAGKPIKTVWIYELRDLIHSLGGQ